MSLINRGRNKPKPQLSNPYYGMAPFKAARSLRERLNTYCERWKINKWLVIEQAVTEFLDREETK